MAMRWRGGLVAALFSLSGLAVGAGLQVSPVSLTIPPSQNADGIWLRNLSAAPLDAQVRVFRWTQEGGEDQLTPTRELLVSPPMLQLPVDGRQLVRAIRAQAPPGGPGAVQVAYRLLIDELPVARGDKPQGLQFVMRHSLPVFVQPAGAAPAPAQLGWKLLTEDDRAVLQVSNTGASHAQLSDLVFTDAAGQVAEVHKGLMGYVLPGATMRWTLNVPAASLAQGSWKATINGKTLEPDVARPAGKAP